MIKKLNILDKNKKRTPKTVSKTAKVETEKDPFEGLIEEIEEKYPGLLESLRDD